MNHTSSTTFSIPTQTDNFEWKIQDGDDDGNNQYTLKTDSDIQIDVGNNSGITSDGSMGTISLEPDPEKMEELEELSETQSEKLNELRDQIINYIANNDLARGDIEQWKRDLATIDDYRRQVNGQDRPGYVSFPGFVSEESVLDPSQLEELNDIYDRWT